MCDKIMVPHDMTCDRWDGKELEGKMFDGGFYLPVNKEIGFHDAQIHGREMLP